MVTHEGSILRYAVVVALLMLSVGPDEASGQSFSDRSEPAGDLASVMQQDAALADVHFVTARRGWAVGDRGVIWHTVDGGQQWVRQVSGVTCPLTSVFFLNKTTGWAVGGATDPYTHLSHGVVLHTHDGGQQWLRWKRAAIPALKQVKFLDAKQGWAIGQTSDMFPHALFTTDDNGRTWTPVPLEGRAVWNRGDFSSALAGVVVGRYGVTGRIGNRHVVDANTQHGSIRSARDVVLNDRGDAYAVGQGGLLLTSSDRGGSWHDRSKTLPGGDRSDFDLQAVAAQGAHVWIAGTPGTCVFHSSDHGKTWQVQSTGQSLPIGALHFVNETHGWAVGALGTILATRDGGAHWNVQRRAGHRVAWLGIFTDADQVPIEMVARLSAGQGYFGAIELIGRRDNEPRGAADPEAFARAREALIDAGTSEVAQAWQFPLRHDRIALPEQKIVRLWENASNRPGLEQLELHLVQRLRIWQPDIVITLPASPKGEQPLTHLINQAVLRAVTRAAASEPATEISAVPTLAPWQVKKVYASLPPRTLGTISVAADQLIPALGRSLSDFVAVPRGLLFPADVAPESVRRFQLLVDALPQGQGRRDFFSGLALQHGKGARRETVQAAQADLQRLKRAASRRQIVRTLVATSTDARRSPGAWLAQITSLTSEMDPVTAGEVLFQLGNQYHQEGHWALADDTFQLLTTEYPQHAFAPAALTWLLQYHASDEVAHIRGARSNFPVRQVRAGPRDMTAVAPARGNDSTAQAFRYASEIKASRIMLNATPQIVFPLAAAYRRAEQPRDVKRLVLGMVRSRFPDAWRRCAQNELLLAGTTPAGVTSSKQGRSVPTWICRRATTKPKLDGHLDDSIWQRAATQDNSKKKLHGVTLHSAHQDDAAWPARVMLSYDDEYLYVAVQCRRAAGTEYPTSDKPRPRDADLAGHDHIDLFLDIDRDRTTYYQLSIDHRGWTAESCWGHRDWNPKWYVAANVAQDTWTCEAAIPLAELSETPPDSKQTWAVGVQRTIPRVGFQSWSEPADIDVMPEGFGTLKFE